MAQSTVKLIVDAQNAIRPLQRVNEQTKALDQSTKKLKGSLDKGNRSLKNTGNAARSASAGVSTLTKAFAPLLAAVSVLGAARFVFVKTAELETQRKSLEVLTDSVEDTNKIIEELQDFGAVTPFTSSELIEQTKRLKAFGFETEELVDTTKRLSEVAGATGADLNGIATAFGQIRAKGKLAQEENLQLLERGVDITTELKRITGLQGEAFEKAQRQGKIGADLVNQALINLTNEGGAFFGGATAQADTLNGKLSTLEDTIDTLARTIGKELEEEIKDVLDFSIAAVKQINQLIKNFGLLKKAIDVINPFEQIKSLKKQLEGQKNINKTVEDAKKPTEEIKKNTESTTLAFETAFTNANLFNASLGQTDIFMDSINNKTDSFSISLINATSEADQLKQKFMEIGQGIEDGIVSGLTDAVMGTKTLAQAAIGVLNDLKRKLVEVAIQRAVSGIGNFFGTALGSAFGGGGGLSSIPFIASLGGAGFAKGGKPPVGKVSLVGEKGPELFVPRSAGTIIPNNKIGGGGTTNVVTVNVDASGSSVAGNTTDANSLGALIGGVVQQKLIEEQRAGGLLNR